MIATALFPKSGGRPYRSARADIGADQSPCGECGSAHAGRAGFGGTPITDGPTMLPPTPSVSSSNDETQRRRIEWSNFVNETLSELRGNPNLAAVTRHLQSLEQAAGSNVPSVPNVVVFGEATVTNGGDGVHDARVLERGSRVGTHGNGNVVLLFPPQEGHSGGSSMLLGPHTLLVILGRHSNPQVRAATAADTTLMNGNLRSQLGALAGRPNR